MKKELTQITEDEKLIGKTIERTTYINYKFFLFFTDNTFCVFQGCGWDEKDVELMGNDYDTTANDYNIGELLHLGFIDKEEADQRIKEYHEANRKLKEEIEIKKLKELQSKYPNI